MLKNCARALLALMLAVAVVVSSMQPAEAGRGGRFAAGVAATLLGLGLLGAYAHGHERHHYRECYPGPERCGWVRRRCFHNNYGDYVCRGGRYTCWREDYCD